MTTNYNLKNVRALFIDGFSEGELRKFCFEEKKFKPLHPKLAKNDSKDDIVRKLLDYAEQKQLFETLLAWAGEHNPARFGKHFPYEIVDKHPKEPNVLEPLQGDEGITEPLPPSEFNKVSKVGDQIGPFTNLKQIGKGGFGIVYRAYDPKLEREVALKLIRPVDDDQKTIDNDEKRRQRFKAEVRAAAKLDHPNIVRIYQFDFVQEQSQFYVVMELLLGGTLAYRLSEKPLPWPRVFALLSPLVEALAYAHRKNIVHRDIKPANVMFDEHGNLKLVDFSLALFEGIERVTESNAILGTLAYMSPEQVRPGKIDFRTDIFSLGVILFEAIAGYNPLIGNLLGEVQYEVQRQRILAELTHNQPIDTTSLTDKAPSKVVDLIQKTIAKIPVDRYQSCEALLADLKSCLKLVNDHHHKGDEIYNTGKNSKQVAKVIKDLENEVTALEELKAFIESHDLKNKLRSLKHSPQIARDEERAIDKINKQKDEQIRFANEDIFEHYQQLDECYQTLIELNPGKDEWIKKRLARLVEQAKVRHQFAVRAEKKIKPDYKAILQHYKLIDQIQQALNNLKNSEMVSLAEELELDLERTIKRLEEKVADDEKFNEVQNLASQGKNVEALDQLDNFFVKKAKYKSSSVAYLLWKLVYAIEHNSQVPLGWKEYELVTLGERLVEAEHHRIEVYREILQPWLNISEGLDKEHDLLIESQQKIETILVSYNKIKGIQRDIVEEIEPGLNLAKKKIGDWEIQLKDIQENVSAEKIEEWFKQLSDIEKRLQNYDQGNDIIELFQRNRSEMEKIGNDVLFLKLGNLKGIKDEIPQILDPLQLTIQSKEVLYYQRKLVRQFIVILIGLSIVIIVFITVLLW